MFTFCPDCSTVFTVKADHLHAAGGRVRCGHCNHVYSAVNYLFEEISVARDAAAEYQASREQTAVADAGLTEGEPLARAMAAGSALPEPDHSTVSAANRALPGGWQHRPVDWRDVAGGAGIGLLLLLLGVQWLYFNRADLAKDADWRPTMEHFCAVLQCDLPLRADVAQIELLERDVRKHPRADDALLINASLVNHAGYTQPYPVFSVSFSNLAGQPVAMRYFRPAEYLWDSAVVAAGMAPGVQVKAVLEIEDPGKEAVSFQLDFL